MIRLKTRIAAAYQVLVAAVDLGGTDGRISFAKLVIVAVLVHTFTAETPMPTLLATVIIAAAYGRSMLLAFLNRANITLQETRSVQITGTLDNRFTDDER